jgi:hypothetical protein
MNSSHDDVEARLRRALPADDAPQLSPALVTGAAGRRAPRLINHGRVTQLGGGALIAVAAVTAGSLVVAQPWQTRAPLFTAAGAGDQATLGAAAAPESSDMRIGVWKQYEYVAGDGLSTDPGSGSVYALERRGTPEATLDDLARAFELTGEAMRSSYFDDSYPSYVVGPEDGSAPALTITWAGTASWWFNDPAASGWFSCASPGSDGSEAERKADEEAANGDDGSSADQPITEQCEPAPPAEGAMPSEEEARGEAAALFAATGLDVAATDIRIMADDWQTVASANLVVDGVTTALDWSVAWGPSGEIAWAYGHAVEVVDKGSYGTVSERDAVSRLADGRWFGAPGPEFQGGMMGIAEMARDGAVTSEGMPGADGEGASGAEAGTSETQPQPDPGAGGTPDPMPSPIDPVDPIDPEKPVEPAPFEPTPGEPGEPTPIDPPIVEPTPEPMPVPEVEVVTLNEASQTLLLVWDADGNAWLVPGHAYPMEEGWWSSVISLVEGVIALPEPIELEPMPMPLPAEE